MTPDAILARAESLGLTLTPDGENLRVRGPRDAIAEITPMVKLHKKAILTTLAANDTPIADDLERLIQRAGAVYQYPPEDFVLMRDMARREPNGLRLALENDPLLPFFQQLS